jgi:membrane protease YdiL (CAAX protease family)
MAWLRYDTSREAAVEAAYDEFVRARPGVFALLGIPAASISAFGVAFVVAFVAGFRAAVTGSTTHALPLAVTTGTIVAQFFFYVFLAIPALRCPRQALRTLLVGCTDVKRTLLFTVGVALVVSLLEYCVIALLATSHVPMSKYASNPIYSNTLFLMIFGVSLAPVCEEFLMQGWLQTRLRRLGGAGAAIVTTAAFIALHVPTSVYDFVRGGNLGFAAYLRASTRSLGAAIAAHFTNNVFFLVLVLGVSALVRHVVHHP